MAMKRQRGETSSLDVESWLSCFGEELVHEINPGNPTLTRGAFGELSIAIQDDGERCRFVALKTIERSVTSTVSFGQQGKLQLTREVFHELCALRYLSPQNSPHPNIVPLLALYVARQKHLSRSSLSLVFPYCPVDLHLALEWRRRVAKPLLPFDVIKTIARDIFTALAHCHSMGVLHRDVKPGNLLVSATGVIQLCDFGLAKPYDESLPSLPKLAAGETGSKGLCTLYYRPPEILMGGLAAEPAVDMYSAGTVLVELVTGKALFPGKNVLDQLSLVYDVLGTPTTTSWPDAKKMPDYGKLSFSTKRPKSWKETIPRVMECPKLPELLSSLVTLDPKRRLTAMNALECDWFSSRPVFASSSQVRNELVPSKLKEPILFSSNDVSIAKREALAVASSRRSFLTNDLLEWKGARIANKSMSALCADFDKKHPLSSETLQQAMALDE